MVLDDVGEPVTLARARAGLLVGRAEATFASLVELATSTLGELRTLGDVEAVEVELETVSASAEHRAAAGRAEAAVAQTLRRAAEAEAAEATRLREEADAAADEAMTDAASWREEHARAVAHGHDLADQVHAATGETDRLRALLVESETARDAARAEVEVLRVDLDQATAAAVTAADDARTAQAATTAAVAEVERTRADLSAARDETRAVHEVTAAVRAEVATARAELVAAVAATATERAHAEQRVRDVREAMTGQVDQLRAQVDALTTERDTTRAALSPAAITPDPEPAGPAVAAAAMAPKPKRAVRKSTG